MISAPVKSVLARIVCLLLGGAALTIPTLVLTAAEKPAAAALALPRVRVAADGRTLETSDGKPFVPFGVTYFRPGTGWAPQVWKQFDAEATRKDFARMKALGVNCVRVFLSYGSFYQEPGRLASDGLAEFEQFLALAEQAGIYMHPTGPDHWEGTPAWAQGDRFADETALRNAEDFWRLFAARYRGRAVIFAYDLLNEPAVAWDSAPMREKWNRWLERKYGSAGKLAQAWAVTNEPLALGAVPVPPREECAGCPRLLDFQHFREEIADEWTRRQAAALKSVDPDALVTVGLIQWSVPAVLGAGWQYSGFRPERQARFLDFLEIHFYPLAHGFYAYGGADDEARNLAYLDSVVREVARPGKPVVLAECGWYGGGKLTIDDGRHPAATEAQQARWCSRLVETTAGLATGWLNWGLYDHPEARDVTQLTGLLNVDGRVKVWGEDFAKLAARYGGKRLPAGRPASRPTLDWDRCATSAAERKEFAERYLAAWKARAQPHPEANHGGEGE